MIELNIGVEPKEEKVAGYRNTELAKWVFELPKKRELIVWYKCTVGKIMTGFKGKPFEIEVVQNSEDMKSYTISFTRKGLNEDEVRSVYMSLAKGTWSMGYE